VAFIRRKKMRGYEYYQAVHNYRDRDGRHRQKVLCHLGTHNSLEAAIAAKRKQIKIELKEASFHRKRATAIRDWLLDRHGWEFVNGKIPSELEAARQLDLWRPRWQGYTDTRFRRYAFYTGTEYMDVEEADIQGEKYMSCIDYHAANRLAEMADSRANVHQENLKKLLRVKRKYF
jgi:hypothetical protein